MNQAQLIKRAILSEKTYKLAESGMYTFLVTRGATKGEIAKSVEKIFDVKVTRVNVLKKAAKAKRIYGTRKYSRTVSRKKAVVILQKGQTIGLFSAKAEKDKKKKTDSSKQMKSTDTKSDEQKKGKGLMGRFRKANSDQKVEEKNVS